MRLNLAERTRLAAFLYKLAVRTQNAAVVKIDPAKASRAINVATGNGLSDLLSSYTIMVSADTVESAKKPPSLVLCSASRATTPGSGDSLWLSVVLGPFHLRKDYDGELKVRNSSSDLESFENLINTSPGHSLGVIPSALGGLKAKALLINDDPRALGDTRRYKPVEGRGTAFIDNRSVETKVWKILDTKLNETVKYLDPRVISQMKNNPHLEPYRDMEYPDADSAVRAINDVTRGWATTIRAAPKSREDLVYVKYTALYLSDSKLFQLFSNLLDVYHIQDEKDPGIKKLPESDLFNKLREHREERKKLEAPPDAEQRRKDMAKRLESLDVKHTGVG